MKDRVPLYPGRVKLTPVSGQENVYDMVRADQPTQEGTPLNKDSLLKDATAALFKLSGDNALPDKVFEKIASSFSKVQSITYYGTGTYGENNPNVVSFEFKPAIVFVYRPPFIFLGGSKNYADFAVFIPDGIGETYTHDGYEFLTNTYQQTERNNRFAKLDGNNLYWYSQNSIEDQLNRNYDPVYKDGIYKAIGFGV